MGIEGLKKYQRRKPKGHYFLGLPPHVAGRAILWLERFRARWRRNLPQWRLAILVGQAKRLALHPPTSEWGRSMLAKRGGHAVQRKYWMQGRPPTEEATRRRVLLRKARKPVLIEVGFNGAVASRTSKSCTGPSLSLGVNGATPSPLMWRDRSKEWMPEPPSLEARSMHKQLDPPGCQCYYCAWPNPPKNEP